MTTTTNTLAAEPMIGAGASVRDYIELLKPRVMSLVVFSGLVGLLVAPGHIHPLLGFVTILCIAMSAGGSAAVNMWYDRDIDAIMLRTRSRPIPQGRVEPQSALEFGAALIFGSVALMALTIGWLAAGLLAFAAGFYIYVYTMGLKRRTPQNIVIGGAAGAFPPMIAWAAVTGHVDLQAIILFAIIFIWTPPHFWALALYRNEDYTRANVPMLPVIKGARRTKIEMLVYTLILFPLSLAPSFTGLSGVVYLTGACILSGLFVVAAVRVLMDDTHRSAKQMFGYSIIYLFALLSLLVIDRVIGMWA
ncbi:MAG TPA: heme o synthase [Alphaproteobacteria bacterium]|nr:heme o synthase [Alphaproteobacteria bacterium]